MVPPKNPLLALPPPAKSSTADAINAAVAKFVSARWIIASTEMASARSASNAAAVLVHSTMILRSELGFSPSIGLVCLESAMMCKGDAELSTAVMALWDRLKDHRTREAEECSFRVVRQDSTSLVIYSLVGGNPPNNGTQFPTIPAAARLTPGERARREEEYAATIISGVCGTRTEDEPKRPKRFFRP